MYINIHDQLERDLSTNTIAFFFVSEYDEHKLESLTDHTYNKINRWHNQ